MNLVPPAAVENSARAPALHPAAAYADAAAGRSGLNILPSLMCHELLLGRFAFGAAAGQNRVHVLKVVRSYTVQLYRYRSTGPVPDR